MSLNRCGLLLTIHEVYDALKNDNPSVKKSADCLTANQRF